MYEDRERSQKPQAETDVAPPARLTIDEARYRELYEPAPIRPNLQARVLPVGLLLRILVATEGNGVIAKKAPSRLPRPSAW
jgi:hypothetical protein